MSSILISWRGQCPERDRRQHLVGHLRELAEIAFERFDERYDRYDHEITGVIFLHREVFEDRRVPVSLRQHPTNADFPDLRYSEFDHLSAWLEDAPSLDAGHRERHFERLKRIEP